MAKKPVTKAAAKKSTKSAAKKTVKRKAPAKKNTKTASKKKPLTDKERAFREANVIENSERKKKTASKRPRKSASDLETSTLLDAIVEGMRERKAKNIMVLNLKEIENRVTDYFVICDADSNTHVGSIADSVIGIGYNVNQREFPGLSATSLRNLCGQEFSLPKVMEKVFSHLEKYYADLKKERYESLKTLYLRRLYGLNETLPFETKDGVSRLKVQGIAENGLLVLEDEGLNERVVDVKEVKWMF